MKRDFSNVPTTLGRGKAVLRELGGGLLAWFLAVIFLGGVAAVVAGGVLGWSEAKALLFGFFTSH